MLLTSLGRFCRALGASPLETFKLPSYAEDMAVVFAGIPSPVPSPCRHRVNHDVEQFMDLDAIEAVDSQEYSG